jgi:hypothetical protein
MNSTMEAAYIQVESLRRVFHPCSALSGVTGGPALATNGVTTSAADQLGTTRRHRPRNQSADGNDSCNLDREQQINSPSSQSTAPRARIFDYSLRWPRLGSGQKTQAKVLPAVVGDRGIENSGSVSRHLEAISPMD